MHLPINHRLRHAYRAIAGAVGVYLVIFGVFAVINSLDDGFFSRTPPSTLGLQPNIAFGLVAIAVGAVVIFSAVRGGQLHHFVTLYAGAFMVVLATLMLAVGRTSANILNFTVGACILWMLLGLLLMLSALYGKVGTGRERWREEKIRHKVHGDVPTQGDMALEVLASPTEWPDPHPQSHIRHRHPVAGPNREPEPRWPYAPHKPGKPKTSDKPKT